MKRFMTSSITFVSLILLTAQPVSSRNISTKLLGSTDQFIEISDQEMGTLYGRFRSGHQPVVYFGVSMNSSWTSPSGDSVTASAVLALDKTAINQNISFKPTVSIDINPASHEISSSGERQINASGLTNASGIVQSNQITGFDNSTENQTILRILSDKPYNDKITNNRFDSINYQQNGLTAQAVIDKRGLGLQIKIPNIANIRQQIGSSNHPGQSSGIYQGIQLLSDQQSAKNSLTMDIVFGNSRLGAMLSNQIQSQLTTLNGLN